MIATFKLDTVSFGTKGQVVIPRKLRKEFEIEDGTKATVVSTPEGILLKPITRTYIKSLRGKYKNLPLMETLKEMKQEEKERWHEFQNLGNTLIRLFRETLGLIW